MIVIQIYKRKKILTDETHQVQAISHCKGKSHFYFLFEIFFYLISILI